MDNRADALERNGKVVRDDVLDLEYLRGPRGNTPCFEEILQLLDFGAARDPERQAAKQVS